jgi:hypothetical protein
MSAGLAVTLGALGGVALCFCDRRMLRRSGLRVPAWAHAHGITLAGLLALSQATCAYVAYGPAAAATLILSAWTFAGMLFVPWINAWPKSALRTAFACAAVSPILAAASVLS